MPAPLDLFRALADDVRLRLLNAILMAELSVAELVDVLRLPQSTVSRHLKPLREAGLVETRREGTSVYYRRGSALSDRDLAAMLEKRLSELASATRDAGAVRKVLDVRRRRSREFFEKIAGRYGELTQPGGGWSALATGLAAGFIGKRVMDLGCGEGALALLLARFAQKVVAVDQSSAMLSHVRARAVELGLSDRVETVESDFERIPLEMDSFDAVFLSQSLHHAARPAHAIGEAARMLRQSGALVLLDLAKHEQDWVRGEWGDQWLGFEEEEVRAWMREAGLKVLQVERLSPVDAAHPSDVVVLFAVGVKRTESN
ncbi:MAG: metalloregulator ArsR/SmtB family transcription factor [Kiritimatiellae bacterium]|nr:metalloregulator ArsR/SmtB family transcription factor [Kiritimatiellia bacterium]